MMKLFVAKIGLAFLSLSAILLFICAQFSTLPWSHLLSRAGLIGFALLGLLTVHAFVAGTIRQHLLRRGAIDTQWLWFADYPKGFLRHFRR